MNDPNFRENVRLTAFREKMRLTAQEINESIVREEADKVLFARALREILRRVSKLEEKLRVYDVSSADLLDELHRRTVRAADET